MKQLSKTQNAIYMAGGILLLVGSATYVTGWPAAVYIYIIGAVSFACMQMQARYEGKSLTLRRLRRQQMIGALLLVLAAVPMLMQTLHWGFAQRNEWVVCLSIAAVLEVYTAWRIPAELEKEQK